VSSQRKGSNPKYGWQPGAFDDVLQDGFAPLAAAVVDDVQAIRAGAEEAALAPPVPGITG